MALCTNDDVLNANAFGPNGAESVPCTPRSPNEAQTGDQQFADWFKNQFPADETRGGSNNWWPGWAATNASFDKLQSERPKGHLPLLSDDEAIGLLPGPAVGGQIDSFDAASWQVATTKVN